MLHKCRNRNAIHPITAPRKREPNLLCSKYTFSTFSRDTTTATTTTTVTNRIIRLANTNVFNEECAVTPIATSMHTRRIRQERVARRKSRHMEPHQNGELLASQRKKNIVARSTILNQTATTPMTRQQRSSKCTASNISDTSQHFSCHPNFISSNQLQLKKVQHWQEHATKKLRSVDSDLLTSVLGDNVI